MESILVTVLVGCFLAAMVPAMLAGLVDTDASNADVDAGLPPITPLPTDVGFEGEERMAA